MKNVEAQVDKRWYRGLAARTSYLAQDRVDIQYPAKEACRAMNDPGEEDVRRLEHVTRFLQGAGRLIMRYDWQEEKATLTGYSDSDWAGCRRTSQSTSGGVITIGKHYIKSWSRTQKCVTLSSAEAELVALAKVSAEIKGIQSVMADWGMKVEGEIYCDSSAALAMTQRRGVGKLRHIDVAMTWMQ